MKKNSCNEGIPSFIHSDGTKIWKNKKGQLHREDGPAVIFPNGQEEWWLNGKLHREDGPAIIYSNHGTWWLDNRIYSEKEYQEEIRKRKLSKLKL